MTEATPQPNTNGAYVDSAGMPAKTADGKAPTVAGQRVRLVGADGQEKQGHWDGESFIEDKAA